MQPKQIYRARAACAARAALPATLAVVALVGLPRWAFGHDKWLEVEPFVASTPTATKLYLVTGEALRQPELLPVRQRSRLVRFQLITPSGRRDLLPGMREDEQPIAALAAGTVPPGTSVLVLDTGPVDILLGAEKFQAYLLEERLVDILGQRVDRQEEDTPGRERYSRFIKAICQVGPKLDANVIKPTGQELEIVPAANPYALGIGGKLSVQVLFHGQPLAGRAVTLANRYHSNVVTRTVRTTAQGQVEISVDRAGDWLVSLVHMERSRAAGADWRSYWSSLTFALPASEP